MTLNRHEKSLKSLLRTSNFIKNSVYPSKETLNARLLATTDTNTKRLAQLSAKLPFKS